MPSSVIKVVDIYCLQIELHWTVLTVTVLQFSSHMFHYRWSFVKVAAAF